MLTAQYCTGHWPFNYITYRYVHNYCGNAQSNTVLVGAISLRRISYICMCVELMKSLNSFFKKCIHKSIWTGVTSKSEKEAMFLFVDFVFLV